MYGTRHGRIEARHDEIQMHRRPVARVVARRCIAWCRRRTRLVLEKVDRRVSAEELDHGAPEAAADDEAQSLAVELRRPRQVVDVNVDQYRYSHALASKLLHDTSASNCSI